MWRLVEELHARTINVPSAGQAQDNKEKRNPPRMAKNMLVAGNPSCNAISRQGCSHRLCRSMTPLIAALTTITFLERLDDVTREVSSNEFMALVAVSSDDDDGWNEGQVHSHVPAHRSLQSALPEFASLGFL